MGYLPDWVGRRADGGISANGVFRSLWYVSFQYRQRGLAAIDAQPAASLVHVLLDGRFGQAEPGGDFLVGQEGRQPEALLLTRAEGLRHRSLR
jgi:hypothetical protein